MNKTLKFISEILLMTFATFLVAVAVFFFLIPSHTAISSISGLSIVLTNFIPLPVSWMTLIINVVLLIVGFLVCGNEFGFKTVYTTILLPLFVALFEWIFPNFESITGDALLDVICYVFTVSIGMAILFNMNASSGGIDIIAKILNKYLHMNLGTAVTVAGIVISFTAIFAYDWKTVILSLLGTYANGIVLDHFIFGQTEKKRVCIISKEHEPEIQEYIVKTLESGATVYQAESAATGISRTEIVTIVDRHEYNRLMDYLTKTDPKAFVTVYSVNSMRYIPKKLELAAMREKEGNESKGE